MQDPLPLARALILGIIGLSALLGAWRGLVREAVSLVSWLSAFVVSFLFVEAVAAMIGSTIPEPEVRLVLAFGILFLIILFLGGAINLVVAQVALETGLGVLDRLLGLLLGAVRGAAIVALLVLLAGLTPLPGDPWWPQIPLLPQFQALASWLKDLLPPPYPEYFNFTAEPATQAASPPR